MRNLFAHIKREYFNEETHVRIQSFNMLCMIGIVICFVAGIVDILTDILLSSVPVLFAMAIIMVWELLYAKKTQRYESAIFQTVIMVFLIGIPLLFIFSGGLRGGIPSFFPFSIGCTAIATKRNIRFVLVGLEFLIYTAACIFTHIYPGIITQFAEPKALTTSIILSTILASVGLVASISIILSIYEKNKQQIERQNAELKKIDLMKTEFLGNMSHEMKTPLAVILGYAQNLKFEANRGQKRQETSATANLIISEVNRLTESISQVLDMTRIEEGGMKLENSPTYIDELIYEVVSSRFPILNRKKNNQITLMIDDNLPRADIDPGRISQVLVNLIANAIRHTENGEITVSAKLYETNMIVVSITDTGTGIESERMPYIFERYHTSSNIRDTGTGLGLYICKHIIQAHGGEITIKSTHGEGTSCEFTVPCMSSDQTANTCTE